MTNPFAPSPSSREPAAVLAGPSPWSLRERASISRCRYWNLTAKKPRSLGGRRGRARGLPLKSDLAAVETHAATAAAITEHFGRMDVLVNNAGIGAPARGDVLDLTPENYDTVHGCEPAGHAVLHHRPAPARCSAGARGMPARSSPSPPCQRRDGLARAHRLLHLQSRAFHGPEGPRAAARRRGHRGLRGPPRASSARHDCCCRAKYDALIADGLVPVRRWGEPDDVAAAVAALATRPPRLCHRHACINVDGGLSIPTL